MTLPLCGGCATDNEFLLKCPFNSRRSDKIPGLMPPRERMALIREKANKAVTASEADRDIVVAQLMLEYRASTDQNLRRESIGAIAKIPHPDREENLKLALSDESFYVRITACRGLVRNVATNQGLNPGTEFILRDLILEDPDKDVKITAIQALCKAGRKCEPETLTVLESCLHDKNLSIRHEAMKTLAVCTGKNFGQNHEKWLAYFQSKNSNDHSARSDAGEVR